MKKILACIVMPFVIQAISAQEVQTLRFDLWCQAVYPAEYGFEYHHENQYKGVKETFVMYYGDSLSLTMNNKTYSYKIVDYFQIPEYNSTITYKCTSKGVGDDCYVLFDLKGQVIFFRYPDNMMKFLYSQSTTID